MIDCGRFPAKRTVGEWVQVSADVFRDGHEILRAQVRYRGPGKAEWSETPM
jgi:starch synthase (maltosyl-transferring)